MAKVITQTEIMQYLGKNRADFPAGTILTPLARDFALENNISIIIGECCDEKAAADGTGKCDASKDKLLRDIIISVKDNAARANNNLSKEEIEKTVIACLERIGCSVIM